MSRHLFYRLRADEPITCKPPLPPGYALRTWHPRRDGLPPAGLSLWPHMVWWLFDRLGIFANPHSGVLMILDADKIVHRSLVTPRWFRFPEMGRRDLQIGDTWTDPGHRSRGLAKAALAAIHERWEGTYERMWYLVEEGNLPSVRVIENCGYRLAGTGERTRPLGIGAFGRFVITPASTGKPQSPGE